jgi:thiol-disulfide isomerase/thioredoxin
VRVLPIIAAVCLVSALVPLAGCGGSSGGGSDPAVLAPGSREAAANLEVPALVGAGRIAVGAPNARPTVVNMWASWCGPCREEMPAVQRFASTHPDVRVIGVAVNDQIDDARAFAKEVGVRFPLGFDADHQVADAYAVSGLPTTVVLDRQGRLAATWPGPVTDADLARLTSAVAADD